MKRTSTGQRTVPLRAVLYGVPGSGKTTFCASAPGAVILDLEHGSSHIDVDRVEVDTWGDVLDVVRETKRGTLVVDSLSKLEEMLTDDILGPNRKPEDTLATFGRGYGQGGEVALMRWREFLSAVDRCPANVIMTAHAQQKPFTDPSGIAFDRWVIALQEKLSQATQRFCDYVFFAEFDLATRAAGKKTVGIFGGRVLRTDANAAYLAKHRGSLPETLPLDYAAFQEAIDVDRGTADKARKYIATLIESVSETELAAKMHDALQAAGTDTVRLGALKRRVESKLSEAKENAS